MWACRSCCVARPRPTTPSESNRPRAVGARDPLGTLRNTTTPRPRPRHTGHSLWTTQHPLPPSCAHPTPGKRRQPTHRIELPEHGVRHLLGHRALPGQLLQHLAQGICTVHPSRTGQVSGPCGWTHNHPGPRRHRRPVTAAADAAMPMPGAPCSCCPSPRHLQATRTSQRRLAVELEAAHPADRLARRRWCWAAGAPRRPARHTAPKPPEPRWGRLEVAASCPGHASVCQSCVDGRGAAAIERCSGGVHSNWGGSQDTVSGGRALGGNEEVCCLHSAVVAAAQDSIIEAHKGDWSEWVLLPPRQP